MIKANIFVSILFLTVATSAIATTDIIECQKNNGEVFSVDLKQGLSIRSSRYNSSHGSEVINLTYSDGRTLSLISSGNVDSCPRGLSAGICYTGNLNGAQSGEPSVGLKCAMSTNDMQELKDVEVVVSVDISDSTRLKMPIVATVNLNGIDSTYNVVLATQYSEASYQYLLNTYLTADDVKEAFKNGLKTIVGRKSIKASGFVGSVSSIEHDSEAKSIPHFYITKLEDNMKPLPKGELSGREAYDAFLNLLPINKAAGGKSLDFGSDGKFDTAPCMVGTDKVDGDSTFYIGQAIMQNFNYQLSYEFGTKRGESRLVAYDSVTGQKAVTYTLRKFSTYIVARMINYQNKWSTTSCKIDLKKWEERTKK